MFLSGSFRKLIEVMAEIIRQRKRAEVLNAHSIALALDDKAPYRIVRYRTCDKSDGRVSEGILAVLRNGGQSSTAACENLDEDYSARMAESILEAIRRLSTSLLGDVQVEVADAFGERVRAYSSDGGKPMLKCGLLLRERFPNMALRIVDRAHCIRRAALPVTMEEKFFKFWHHVFDKRHAVIPDIQNSSEWRLRFTLIQKCLGLIRSNQRTVCGHWRHYFWNMFICLCCLSASRLQNQLRNSMCISYSKD